MQVIEFRVKVWLYIPVSLDRAATKVIPTKLQISILSQRRVLYLSEMQDLQHSIKTQDIEK